MTEGKIVVPTWEHEGWSIHVNAQGQFWAIDPNEPPPESLEHVRNTRGYMYSETLEALKKRITTAGNKRTKAKAEHIELPVYTSKGVAGVVTGLHVHSGRILGTIPREEYNDPDLYPDLPWIRETIAEIDRLYRAQRPLNKKLETVKLERRYKQPESENEYAAAIEALKRDYTAKLLKAETMAEEETERKQALPVIGIRTTS